MFRAQIIRFGRSRHANLAFEFFDKQASAQFVVTHVGGENDRALRCGQLVQEIFSLEFVSKLRSQESEDGGVCQRLGEIVERAKRPQIVHERRRTRQNNGERRWTVWRAGPAKRKKTSVQRELRSGWRLDGTWMTAQSRALLQKIPRTANLRDHR
jgi:hypothetical protein